MMKQIDRLKKRISKQIIKKRLLGDILIKGEEFTLLCEYLKVCYRKIVGSYTHIIADTMFCVALVQLGIKKYDGNFWGHVAEVLEVKRLSGNHQAWIGDSFIHTLKMNDKIIAGDNDRVNSILMHGFVADNYSDNLFTFLFAYFRIDLERDISRLTKIMFDNLIEAIKSRNNTDRTYLLIRQTADAISNNPKGSKIRLRHILKLIDKAFWDDVIYDRSKNRITQRLNKWISSSDEYNNELNASRGYVSRNGMRRKSISHPHLLCNLRERTFRIVIPKQIVNFNITQNLFWKIKISNKEIQEECTIYEEGVTGYKTQETSIDISIQDIFSQIEISLNDVSEGRIIKHKIASDSVRFFNCDGELIKVVNHIGEAYSFTKPDNMPESEALIDLLNYGEYYFGCYIFDDGDIVSFQKRKAISIGNSFKDRLQNKGLVEKVFAPKEDANLRLYSKPPAVFFTVPNTGINGTFLTLNSLRYRLSELVSRNQVESIDLGDDNIKGFVINMKNIGCAENKLYTVEVNIPNNRSINIWEFALLNNVGFCFEDAPYVFQPRGTIAFKDTPNLVCLNKTAVRDNDSSAFNFEIETETKTLNFAVNKGENSEFIMSVEIPALYFSIGKNEWYFHKMDDIWYSNFPKKILVKCPGEKLSFILENCIYDEFNEGMFSKSYKKNHTTDTFECDMTAFKSWFNREEQSQKLYIQVEDTRYPFLNIITRSLVNNKIISGDYKNNILEGQFDIFGDAEYYIDIFSNRVRILKKGHIIDGKIRLNTELKSGKYKFIIYEVESNTMGFGEASFKMVVSFYHDIVNPYNMCGRCFSIRQIKIRERSTFSIHLDRIYRVNLTSRIDDIDQNLYKGMMIESGRRNVVYSRGEIIIDFFNKDELNKTYITFPDGEDKIEFLFDETKRILARQPIKGLTRTQEYRRYAQSLYPEDYIYIIEFVDC